MPLFISLNIKTNVHISAQGSPLGKADIKNQGILKSQSWNEN